MLQAKQVTTALALVGLAFILLVGGCGGSDSNGVPLPNPDLDRDNDQTGDQEEPPVGDPDDESSDVVNENETGEDDNGSTENDAVEEEPLPLGRIYGDVSLSETLQGKKSAVMLFTRSPFFQELEPVRTKTFAAASKANLSYDFDDMEDGTYYLLFMVDYDDNGNFEKTDVFYPHHQSPVNVRRNMPNSVTFKRDFSIGSQNPDLGSLEGQLKLGAEFQDKRFMLMAAADGSVDAPQFYPMSTEWIEPDPGNDTRDFALRNLPPANFFVYAMVVQGEANADLLLFPEPYSPYTIPSDGSKTVAVSLFYIGVQDPALNQFSGTVTLAGAVNRADAGDVLVALYNVEPATGDTQEQYTPVGFQRLPFVSGQRGYAYNLFNLRMAEYWLVATWQRDDAEESLWSFGKSSVDMPFTFTSQPQQQTVNFDVPITRVTGTITVQNIPSGMTTGLMIFASGIPYIQEATFGGSAWIDLSAGGTTSFDMFPVAGSGTGFGAGWDTYVYFDTNENDQYDEGDTYRVSNMLTGKTQIDGARELEEGQSITVSNPILK